MKKLLCIVLGLLFLIIPISIIVICSSNGATGDEKIAEDYIKSQGYTITARVGKTAEYTLEKDMLLDGSTGEAQIWSVQKEKPDKYFGKKITGYRFIVKNHPLEKIYKNAKIHINVMICDGQVIGGTSVADGILGGCYSIDGKS